MYREIEIKISYINQGMLELLHDNWVDTIHAELLS